MCKRGIADFIAQKFGRQIRPDGTSDAQKSMNQFQYEIVIPTNWRSYTAYKAKLPVIAAYGGFVPQSPYFYEKNYTGLLPMKQQPVIDPPQPYTVKRYN